MSSYHGKRWKPIRSKGGRGTFRKPQGWEVIGLAVLGGFIAGFFAGIALKLASPPVIVYQQGGTPVVEKPAVEMPSNRQRVDAALARFRESGGRDKDLADLYFSFKDKGWDIPEEIQHAFDDEGYDPERTQDY